MSDQVLVTTNDVLVTFAGSVGGAPIEILKQYIQQQDPPH